INHQQGPPRDRPSHAVRFAERSFLGSLAPGTAFVNSHHHQAVEQVGRELAATAWSSDGLIEALEDSRPGRFVVAVQWHPELGWRDDPLSLTLFARFVSVASQYALEASIAANESAIAS